MNITLFPSHDFKAYKASVKGSVLTVEGVEYDFTPLKPGYRLPGKATGCPYIVPTYPVENIDGELYLTMFLGVEVESPEEVRSPSIPLTLTNVNGDIPFPGATPIAASDPVIPLVGDEDAN